MRERAVRFGAENHLVGVLALPDEAAPGAPTIVFANVGFGHRMGPHRLFVDVARALAARGIPSLRFNLSGLGDSAVRSAPEGGAERARADLLDALEHLHARRGADRFALVGMCSAVDPAHALAVEDRRVVAAAFLDGYAYPTVGYHLRRFLSAAGHPARTLRSLATKLGRAARAESVPEDGEPVGFWERVYPARERFRADVLAMRERGVRLYFGYARGWYHFNHRGQFAAMLGLRRLPPGITVDYHADTDHMLTPVAPRARAAGQLTDWLAGSPAQDPASADVA
jgi:hypothetical protein